MQRCKYLCHPSLSLSLARIEPMFTVLMDGCGAQVREIEEVHVSDLSVELFEERYAYTHRPLVVRNASIFWEALQVTIKMPSEADVALWWNGMGRMDFVGNLWARAHANKWSIWVMN